MVFQFPPRLMQAKAAAYYLGVSPTKLRSADIPVRVWGGNKMYDIRDLDAYADKLRYVDGYEAAHETFDGVDCDELFGIGKSGLTIW